MVFYSDYPMMIVIRLSLMINRIVYPAARLLLPVFFYYLIFSEPEYAMFHAYFNECRQGLVKVTDIVPGRYLGPYPCLSVGHNREEENYRRIFQRIFIMRASMR